MCSRLHPSLALAACVAALGFVACGDTSVEAQSGDETSPEKMQTAAAASSASGPTEKEIRTLIGELEAANFAAFGKGLATLQERYPEHPHVLWLEAHGRKVLLEVTQVSRRERLESTPVALADLPASARMRFGLIRKEWVGIADLPERIQPAAALKVLNEVSAFLDDNPRCWEARFLQAHLALGTYDVERGREAAAYLQRWNALDGTADPVLVDGLCRNGWLEASGDAAPEATADATATDDSELSNSERLARALNAQKKD